LSNSNRSFFDEQFIADVRSSVDIAELIGEVVSLRRQGRNYIGLCPFHTEKTPSFTVAPDKQIFHCFGCGAGGDVFSFVGKREGLTFPEAVRKLAERAGIAVPEPDLSPEEAVRRTELDRVRGALEMATAQYQRWLWSDAGKAAQQYLERRGFDRETLDRFKVGYAPPAWDGLVQALGRRGVSAAMLVRAGLASEAADDRHRIYDRFRGRIMFPIWDLRGRTIAFGGRILPGTPDEDKAPKYLNSPETELFVKGRQLYAHHLARAAIHEQGRAIIVEGYVDAMTCHRAGFRNVVASLGTALTVVQGRLSMAQAKQVLVAYDADSAGQTATMRGLDILTGLGADVRVVRLPEGKDPDECIARGGAAAFAAAIDRAQDYVAYRFDAAARDAAAAYGAGTARAAAATVATIAPTLATLDSAVAREAYVQQFARALDVSEASLWNELRRGMAQPGHSHSDGRGHPGRSSHAGPAATQGLLGGPAHQRAQEQLISAMLSDLTRVAAVQAKLRPEEFPDEACRGVVRVLYQLAGQAGQVAQNKGSDQPAAEESIAAEQVRHEVLRVLEASGQVEAIALVSRLAIDATEPAEELRERVCSDCVRALQEHSWSNRIDEVRQEVQRLERAGQPVPARLLEEYTRLVRATKGGSLMQLKGNGN